MKNRFRKLAALLGIAVLVTSQGGALPVHAEEAAAVSQSSSVQPVTNVWLADDGNIHFTDPNNGVNTDFSGTLTLPSGREMDYYPADPNNFFYTFEYIEDAGEYSFVVRTHDTSNRGVVVGEATCRWTYSKPSNELSAPEDVVWDEDGILTFKEVADAPQYSFNVYDSEGKGIGRSFGSNVLGTFMKKADGYVKINLSGYLYYQQGVTAGNGCYVNVRATSDDIKTTAHSAWVTSNPLKSNNTTTTKSSKSSGSKACNHEYEWVSEREATQISNGEEIYQCKYCGDVKERMEMANSAYAKFNKDAISAIDKAQANGTVTLKTDMWVSFYASVIDTLKTRPDVTLVVNYFYQGVRYTMTIPAGADLSALVDSEGYYGFRYLDLFFPGQEVK